MKTTPILLVALLAGWSLRAQDAAPAVDESGEVDRILAEIEDTGEAAETPAADAAEGATTEEAAAEEPMEAAAEEEAEPVEEVAAEPEMAEATEETAASEEDASDMPSFNLPTSDEVEGLDIAPGQQKKGGEITINYTNVRLADMVRIFAQTSGANIIIPEGLDEPVSGNLNDVHWREALEVILEDKGYVLMERKAGIFTIVSRDRIADEPLTNETLGLQYITVETALPAVQGLIISSNATVTPLPAANVLIVSEVPQQMQEIKRVLSLVDRPRQQVFIEAKFVELNDSAIQDLGINWQVLQGYTVRATGLTSTYNRTDFRTTQDAQALVTSNGNQSSSTRGSTGSSTITDDRLVPGIETDTVTSGSTNSSSSGSQNSLFESVVRGSNFTGFDSEANTITTAPSMEQEIIKSAVLSADDFALTLSALQQLDGVRIVSNPKMLVANGETATIHVGRNEPNVRAIPQGENATTFAYVLEGFIEIGVKLEVTPVISTAKNITVSIIPELSRIIGEKVVGEAGTSFPITQIRRIDTEFAVESGKTVAIGGLTQGEEQEVVRKVPLLGDLPILGKYLFRHTSTQDLQDEIIIFVTVNMGHVDDIDDRSGIPEHGELINTWLDTYEKKKASKE